MPTTAEVLVDQLVALGARLAFGVPGESYLAVLDALHDRPALRFVTCRQEGGAAFAAEAAGRLTGLPGLLMVTRGPGATNAAIGIHAAQQAETPLVVLVGQVPRHQRGRDAFQELDLRAVFGSMCRWVTELDDPDRATEVLARAWQQATSGRPGPVVVGLPEDVLDLPSAAQLVPPSPPAATAVSPATAAAVHDLLSRAERPLVVVGGSRWTTAARSVLAKNLTGLPVVTGFRRQDLVDHRSVAFAGSLGLGTDPRLADRVRAADLLLVVGDRLDDPSTDGFTLLDVPEPAVPLVHVHPDPRELGRVFRPTLAVAADPGDFLVALGPLTPRPSWQPWRDDARAGYVAWSATPGLLDDVARGLRALLPDDAVLTAGAGNFTRPFQRSFAFHAGGRQLAPPSGAMGYGLPAAVAAKLLHPERTVVCVAGDGDLLMTSQELATAAAEGLGIVVLVVDNSSYGTIRTHQQRRYPGRPFATRLVNPDFTTFARSFGARAERVTTARQALDALARAVDSSELSLVHLAVDDAAALG